MRALIPSLFFFTTSAWAGFTCQGKILHGTSQSLITSSSEACLVALESAQKGFVCYGRVMMSEGMWTSNFRSSEECLEAISAARNGFTCNWDVLLTHSRARVLKGPEVCQQAVKLSK